MVEAVKILSINMLLIDDMSTKESKQLIYVIL